MALSMALLPSLIHKPIALTPRALRSSKRSRPRLFILTVAHPKGQHLALTRGADAHDGQDRHFAALPIIDDGEVGAISTCVGVALFQRALFPCLILTLQRVEDA